MTGSTPPPKPFVHSLGDSYFLGDAEGQPCSGGQEGEQLGPSSRKHTQHHRWQVEKQGVVRSQLDRGQALYAQRAPHSIDSEGQR